MEYLDEEHVKWRQNDKNYNKTELLHICYTLNIFQE